MEVKGPGDKLQENQKVLVHPPIPFAHYFILYVIPQVWIDIMLRNNIAVEVCLIEERGAEKPAKPVAKNKRKRAAKAKEIKCSDNDCEEEVPYIESEDEKEDGTSAARREKRNVRPPKKRLKTPADSEIICLE